MPRRCQLAQAIVFSRLIFGVEIWPSLHPKQESKIDSFMHKVYRAIAKKISRGKDFCFSNLEVEATLVCLRAKAIVRLQRLRYFRKLGEEAPTILGDLLEREDRESTTSWLNLIREDLEWVMAMKDESIPKRNPQDVGAWWPLIQGLGKRWDKMVSRMTITEALQDHLTAKQKWTRGKEPIISMSKGARHGAYECPQCRASFYGQTALSNHLWKKHGVHAEVRSYVDGTSCGSCMKDFHTLQRIRQHLQYATGCLDHLKSIWMPMEVEMVESNICLKSAYRIPWTYREGPRLPSREDWELAAPSKVFPTMPEELQLRRCLEQCRDAANEQEETNLQESWLNLMS